MTALSYDPRAHGALCDKCPLDDKVVVPPEGPRHATIAVVGEAPGYNEERGEMQNGQFVPRPFIGPSGKMLDDVLGFHGVARTDVWVSNAGLCRAPELRLGLETTTDAKALNKAIECCKPRLQNEIEGLTKLRVIIPLGATAIRSLTGRKNVSVLKARGFVWDPPTRKTGKGKTAKSTPLTTAVMVPSVHPAFVLRAPAWEPVLACDIDRAVRASLGRLQLPHPTLTLAPPYEKIDSALARLGLVVAVDVETTKASPTTCDLFCIGISDGKRAVVIPWARTRSPRTPYYGKRQGAVAVKVRRCLETRTSITHNGPGFDQIVMARYGIDLDR